MTKIKEPAGDLNFIRFAELLEEEAGLDAGTGRRVLQAVLNILARHVAAGFQVRFTNFGSFYARDRRLGSGGLPHRRAEGAQLPGSVRTARFRPTGLFADAVRSREPVTTLRKRPKGFADAS